MVDNFDLKKYLVENKATMASRFIIEDLDLGNVAFGENPAFVKLQGADVEEKNTEQESWLQATLQDWFTLGDYSGDDANARTERLAKLLMQYKGDLFKLKSKYPNVFMQPNQQKYVYRGTSVAPDEESVYRIIKESPEVYVAESGEVLVPFLYKPKSLVQSWAIDSQVALQYAEMYNEDIQAMLIAKTDDSFWMNPASATIFSGFEEEETLHFGQELKTYVEFGEYGMSESLMSILYDILNNDPLGTSADEGIDVDMVFEHPDFNAKFKEFDGYSQLPW
tara:strand:- start:849 stop:1685 length:837 start_codon:yes stop_codon:yes gene_type:complete